MTEHLNKKSTIASIIAVFALVEATFILTPALALLAAKYPDMPYATITLLSTLPNLIGIPMAILGGALIKKKVGFRPLITFSIILVVIGGVIPYFVNTFGGWILARCLFGVGFGIVAPMGATMVGMFYHGEKGVRIQGVGSVIQNLAGVIMQLLSGWVCLINVDLVWVLHIIFLAPLIVFLVGSPNKEDMVAATAPSSNTEISSEKTRLPGRVWIISLVYGIGIMCVFGFLFDVASFMQNEGIGNSAMAGIVAALYTVGGILAGLAFPFFMKTLKRALIPVLFIITAAGMMLGYWGNSTLLLGIASFVIGFAFLMIWPANVVTFGEVVAPQDMGVANGILVGSINLFSFLASFFIQAVLAIMGANTRNPVVVGGIGLLIIGIIYIVVNISK